MSSEETLFPVPVVTKIGPAYTATAGAVTFKMTHLKERGDELSAELTVELMNRHVSQARFNLCSLSARATQAKYLGSVVGHDKQWRNLLEETCLGVMRLHRQGEPVVDLNGTFPVEAEDPVVLGPLLSYKAPTILFGEGGSYKSTLMAAMALQLSTGVQVIPGMEVLPSKVLVLDTEAAPGKWARRLRELAQGVGIEPEHVPYKRLRRSFAEASEEIGEYVAQNQIEVLFIDSLVMAMGAQNEHQGAEAGAIAFFAALGTMDVTTVMADHVAGADMGTERAVPKPYGSVFKRNLAREVWEVRAEKEPVGDRTEVMLIHNKTNYARRQAPLGFTVIHEPGAMRIVRSEITAPEMQAARSQPDRIAAAVRLRAMSYAEVAEQTGLSQNVIRAIVSRSPRFTKVGEGNRLFGLAQHNAT